MTMGIYALHNTVTGKLYIGSSAKLEQREQAHRFKLNHTHYNAAIHADARLYGTYSFEWHVLEVVEEILKLGEVEQRWIDHFAATWPAGLYNIERRVTRSSAVSRTNPLPPPNPQVKPRGGKRRQALLTVGTTPLTSM